MNKLFFMYPLIGTTFFVLGILIPEFLLRKSRSVVSSYISDYITGPYYVVTVSAFWSLAIACVILGVTYSSIGWLFLICGIGLVGVVLTEYISVGNVPRGTLHKICAGVAYTAATIAECLILYGTVWFWVVLAAPISAALFMRFAPTKEPQEEKIYTILIVVGLFVIIISGLHGTSLGSQYL